jgi:hypothetical protein
MRRMSKEEMGLLLLQIQGISQSAQAGEAKALFLEAAHLDKVQTNWAKASKLVGGVVALVAFFVMDSQDLRGFPYEPLIFGLVLSALALVVTFIGIAMLGKTAMRSRVDDWAQRAVRVVREHDKAAP